MSTNWTKSVKSVSFPVSRTYPNSKLRLLPPSPFWFWPSKPSFIYLCKFVQTESPGATRVDLPPNSTQVSQEPSHLMVQNALHLSSKSEKQQKTLKAPNHIWVLFWSAVWGHINSSMTSNKRPFSSDSPSFYPPPSQAIISQCTITALWFSCFHRLGPQAKCNREEYNHTRARPCSRGQNTKWEEQSLAAPYATKNKLKVSRVCVVH